MNGPISWGVRCDGITRRHFLRMGPAAAFGIGLADLVSLRRRSARAAAANERARSCILIWLDGGPSHLETFDPKPEAPAEVRGPLETIATAIPGVRFSECLSMAAERMSRLALVRSVTSPLGEHNLGTHYLLTGFRPTAAIEYPSFHAVGAHVKAKRAALPSNIAIPHYGVGGGKFSGGGFLPPAARPFSLHADPAKPDFRVRDLDFFPGVDRDRIERRRAFVHKLDQLSQALDASTDGAVDPDLEQAHRLVTSKEARGAFELEREPVKLRQRYGDRSVGQSCLLARRLVERGVPFVTVNHIGWDTHDNLFTRLKEGYTGAQVPVGLVPSFDRAFSALVDDLADRGLLATTLVIAMGEFGRTPKLNPAGGRDHWPRAFSVMLAGGGVPGGQVIGSTDATAESPKDRPVTPADLVRTIYQLLGIDPELELRAPDGRPIPITDRASESITELLG